MILLHSISKKLIFQSKFPFRLCNLCLCKLSECLEAENMALGTSLLSGKVGEKIFADSFTLSHDVSDKETWFTPFFDGEGVVRQNDKHIYIENGVLISGYADKRTAEKYGVPHTGSASFNITDIPTNGYTNFRIERSDKTVKQLLDGRLTVVPIIAAGGGYNDKGEYDPEWLGEADRKVLAERADALTEYYSKYTVLDIYHVDGERTNGENYADLGAMECITNAVRTDEELRELAEQIADELYWEGMTEYDCVYAVNEYLCNTVYYPDESSYPVVRHMAYGAEHDGCAVCEGYAAADDIVEMNDAEIGARAHGRRAGGGGDSGGRCGGSAARALHQPHD